MKRSNNLRALFAATVLIMTRSTAHAAFFHYAGGVADSFSGATEAPHPSAALQARYSPSNDYDQDMVFTPFAETFDDLPCCMVNAQLEAVMKPIPGGQSEDDAILLSFTNSTGGQGPATWQLRFGSPNTPPGLFPNRWDAANYPNGAIVTLNLGSLPTPQLGNATNLLSTMNQEKHLDIVVEDNTSVDFINLRIETQLAGDVDGDGCVDAADFALAALNNGSPVPQGLGDPDGDGVFTTSDLALIQLTLGQCCTVPEPAATGLAGLLAIAWLGLRMRKKAGLASLAIRACNSGSSDQPGVGRMLRGSRPSTFMMIQRLALLIAAAAALESAIACAAPTFLVTQGTTLYRFQSPNHVQTFTLSDAIAGMTTVPLGMSTGNLNGGAAGGDVLAVGTNSVYRIDNPLSGAPTLTQIGVRGGVNASPVFVGNRLFGIGGDLPDGSYLVEWDPGDFSEIGRWATGVFGGPGGLVHLGGNDFLYSEFVTGALWKYALGNTTSTAIGSLPAHDYSGLEMVGGTLYASFALKPAGSGAMAFGTLSPTDASFTQLATLGVYQDGITGIAAIVPEPCTLLLASGCSIVLVGLRRWRA